MLFHNRVESHFIVVPCTIQPNPNKRAIDYVDTCWTVEWMAIYKKIETRPIAIVCYNGERKRVVDHQVHKHFHIYQLFDRIMITRSRESLGFMPVNSLLLLLLLLLLLWLWLETTTTTTTNTRPFLCLFFIRRAGAGAGVGHSTTTQIVQ